MQTIHTDVFTFDELDDSAKEKAREWYRNASAVNQGREHGCQPADVIQSAQGGLTGKGGDVHALRGKHHHHEIPFDIVSDPRNDPGEEEQDHHESEEAGRSTKGVHLIKPQQGDSVASVARISAQDLKKAGAETDLEEKVDPQPQLI